MTDDDDLAWEEWLSKSDAQQDAELEREMQKFCDWIDSLTPIELYQYHRRSRLRLCLNNRRLMKRFPELFTPFLRSTQKRLLEARIAYYTGKVSGHA